MLKPTIIFEDDYLLVVNKPPGLVVNNSDTTKKVETLQDWLLSNFDYPISKSLEYRSGIVHRLDKDTSGVLVVAKTKSVFEALQQSFKNREVNKTYLALAHGHIKDSEGEITQPVGRLPWNRRRFGVLPGGREATTFYKVLGVYQKDLNFHTMLELAPRTGRTHQIRIHLKYLGHPIVSDTFYAGRKTSRHDLVWCPRLFLHAAKISFNHPVSGEKVTFEAPLSADLNASLQSLVALSKLT
jgi:23S rRNA pseudouridine1911/1915/1917 synthase